jgi:quinol monooxygenase YgiN
MIVIYLIALVFRVEEYSDDKTERAHESTAKFKRSIEELEMLIES